MKKFEKKFEKISKAKKPIVVTHNDADGAMAAWLMKQAVPAAQIVFSAAPAAQVDAAITTALEEGADAIVITDCSPSSVMAEKLDCMEIEKLLVDHHKTAEYLNKYSWAEVKPLKDGNSAISEYRGIKLIDECAASNVCTILQNEGIKFNEEVKNFITVVNINDMWQFDRIHELEPLTEEFMDYNRVFYRTSLEDFIANPKFTISPEDKLILQGIKETEDNFISSLVEYATYTEIDGIPAVRIRTAGRFNMSKLTLSLLKKFPEHNLFVYENAVSISLRVRKGAGIDAGAIAKKYGGGGHAAAAGIPIPENLQDVAFNATLKRI